jgi:hypothetical protein
VLERCRVGDAWGRRRGSAARGILVVDCCLRLVHEAGPLLGREVGVVAHGDGLASWSGRHVSAFLSWVSWRY